MDIESYIFRKDRITYNLKEVVHDSVWNGGRKGNYHSVWNGGKLSSFPRKGYQSSVKHRK